MKKKYLGDTNQDALLICQDYISWSWETLVGL